MPKKSESTYLNIFFPALFVILLAGVLYNKGLFLDQSQMHGDSLIHGLPLLSHHVDVLKGQGDILWSDKIFGGHPIHAEGQFSFFSPLNTVVAYLFPPIQGLNILHFLSLVLSGLGVCLLCHQLNLSRAATTTACLSICFSSFWIGSQHNLTIASTLTWVPWLLWSFERWYKNPRKFLALGVITAITCLSGYPQLLHGALIYVTLSLIVRIGFKQDRENIKKQFSKYFFSGIGAILICLLLSAVQVIPLLELTNQSIRSEGAGVLWPIEQSWVYEGMIFSSKSTAPHSVLIIHSLGSLSICLIASLTLLLNPSSKIIGHMIPSLFLLQMGLGPYSPLIGGFYEYIPGVNFFRSSTTYLSLSVIGVSILAAMAIDNVYKVPLRTKRSFLIWTILSACWIGIIYYFHDEGRSTIQYVIAALISITVVAQRFINSKNYFKHILYFLLIVEIMLLRFSDTAFYDNAHLEKPFTVKYLQQDKYLDRYKIFDTTAHSGYVFYPPRHPGLVSAAKRSLASVSGSTQLLWGIASLQGAHALPTNRSMLAIEYIRAVLKEGNKNDANLVGRRLINTLGVKYIMSIKPPKAEGIIPAAPPVSFAFVNPEALPKIRGYTAFHTVSDNDKVIELLGSIDIDDDHLIIETREADTSIYGAGDNKNDAEAIRIDIQEQSSTRYKLKIEASNEGWVFIADQHYPGWEATINNQETPIYHANLLGKAIWVPKGNHDLVIEFRSKTYNIGLSLFILGLLITLGLCIKKRMTNI
jgi:hypothetical protein